MPTVNIFSSPDFPSMTSNQLWAELVEVRLQELESEMKAMKALALGGDPSALSLGNKQRLSDRSLLANEASLLGRTRAAFDAHGDPKRGRSPSNDSMYPEGDWSRGNTPQLDGSMSSHGQYGDPAIDNARRQRMPQLYEAVTSARGMATSGGKELLSSKAIWADDIVEELWNLCVRNIADHVDGLRISLPFPPAASTRNFETGTPASPIPYP
jgi:hypothetical protein